MELHNSIHEIYVILWMPGMRKRLITCIVLWIGQLVVHVNDLKNATLEKCKLNGISRPLSDPWWRLTRFKGPNDLALGYLSIVESSLGFRKVIACQSVLSFPVVLLAYENRKFGFEVKIRGTVVCTWAVNPFSQFAVIHIPSQLQTLLGRGSCIHFAGAVLVCDINFVPYRSRQFQQT